MPLIDDLRTPGEDVEQSRRAFLGAVGSGALALASLGTGVTAVRFLWPEVLFEEETLFRIGRPDDIAVGTVLVLPVQKLYVLHAPEGFVAMSATCTHLGCLTRYEPDLNRILCPCHGSRFSTDGKVVMGPAPRPLPRVQLTLEQGILVVDSSKTVEPDFVLKV